MNDGALGAGRFLAKASLRLLDGQDEGFGIVAARNLLNLIGLHRCRALDTAVARTGFDSLDGLCLGMHAPQRLRDRFVEAESASAPLVEIERILRGLMNEQRPNPEDREIARTFLSRVAGLPA